MQLDKSLVLVMGLFFGYSSTKMTFVNVKNGVKLTCDTSIKIDNEDKGTTLVAADSSKEIYSCGSNTYLVYVNTGKNFVSLKSEEICGLILASVISTVFISIAVYSLSAQNKSRTYQASDRHPLMRNDVNETLYSHLNNEGKSTYSELGKKRQR
ncbi:TYRO protein tyrosine kinase-binding protein isoform X4 [Narcine bancroftii]|uniref:TYRO protein tyrosine kinase-binding protein isoform X4 n=1 Tax=Narcine bancroftii TaxID=1343680 RepID=UPI0038317ADC